MLIEDTAGVGRSQGRECKTGRQCLSASASPVSEWNWSRSNLLSDDVVLHRSQRAEQLILFSLADVVRVKGLDQVFYQRVEIGRGDSHASVGGLHVFASVLLRS